MEKVTRTYQVARSYRLIASKKKESKMPIQALPEYSLQEVNINYSIQDKQASNMFQRNSETRLRKLDLQNEKPYEFVGMKEMKDFIVKLQKKRKMNHHSSAKLSLLWGNESNVSNFKPQVKPKFLTKEEVMKNVHFQGKNQYKSLQQTYLCDQNSIVNHYTGSMVHTTQISTPVTQEYRTCHKNIKSQEFSLKRIKSKLKKYSNCWNKQISKRQKGFKKEMHPRQYAEAQISLIQKSRDFRELKQKQQKLDFLSHIKNIQPRQWDCILRKKGSLQDMKCKEIEQVVANGWSVNGRGKLRRQMDWIDRKNEEGYFFRQQKIQRFNIKSDE